MPTTPDPLDLRSSEAVNLHVAARYLGVSLSTLRRLIDQGLLPCRRVNPANPRSSRLIPKYALIAYVSAHTHLSTE